MHTNATRNRQEQDTKGHEYDTEPTGGGHTNYTNATQTRQEQDTQRHYHDTEPTGAGRQ